MELCVGKEQAKLPQEISLISLIQSRYSEIKQIINEFKTTSPKLASQKLPIHMRRRAASHNVKRLPAKTRIIISRKTKGKDVTSYLKEKKRKQQKKYRKKSKIDLSHAVREAKNDRSLLHLWFVKRFKMISLFNQLIPNYNTTKNQRKLQRMSKKGCVHFYFPQFRSIIIRIVNIDLVCQKLSKISKIDLAPFFDDQVSSGCSTRWIQFFSETNGDANSKIIGPGYLIFDKKNLFLIIWCHTLIQSEIFNHLLASFHGFLDEVTNGDKIYQFFSLIGSESLNHLKKVLGECDSFLPDNFQDGKVFKIPNRNFLVDSLDSKRICEDNDENNFLIIHMTRLNNRDSIFLTTPYLKAKDFWYKLVKNRTHLVGGLRDIKILTSEMRCLHFPSIGYPDLPEELNSHHKTWTQIMSINSASTEYALLRNRMIINKLRYPSLNVSLIQDLLQSNPELINSLVYIEMICFNRGTPEKGDIICIPLENDMKKYLGRRKIDIKIDQTGYGPVEPLEILNETLLEQSSRKVIGLVEFGYFSLDLGGGRGFGAITFTSLEVLIKLNNEKLIALTRSRKSNTFRFVEIIIDNFKLI